jgi:hypothetical protein
MTPQALFFVIEKKAKLIDAREHDATRSLPSSRKASRRVAHHICRCFSSLSRGRQITSPMPANDE